MHTDSFVVKGGNRLSGDIIPQGAKNEALQVISAVLLTGDKVTISNIPDILDVRHLFPSSPGIHKAGLVVFRPGFPLITEFVGT